MSNLTRIVKNGIGSIVCGIVVMVIDYFVCGRKLASCPWGVMAENIGYWYDGLIHHIGRALGVRYGYVPYFPNRATQMFLLVLAETLPWVSFFLLGVFIGGLARTVLRLLKGQSVFGQTNL